MELCRFTLTPLSPWASWLRSDTLYGLICWHVAESEGEAACRQLIDAFRSDRPPFLLSSAMPAGFLPMPVLPPLRRGSFRDMAARLDSQGQGEAGLFGALQKFRKFRKQKWLDAESWRKHRNSMSTGALFQDYCRAGVGHKPWTRMAVEPHVGIDRSCGTAAEGQLFFLRLHYFESGARLHLYARAENRAYLLRYLQLIGDVGFGRDSSTGKGRFAVEAEEDFDAAAFEVPDANARLLLSVCASPCMTEVGGWRRLEVKRGKTGPGYANPFKKPFLMFQEGAVLRGVLPGPFVLQGINADSRVAQILFPLELPCRLQPGEVDWL